MNRGLQINYENLFFVKTVKTKNTLSSKINHEMPRRFIAISGKNCPLFNIVEEGRVARALVCLVLNVL